VCYSSLQLSPSLLGTDSTDRADSIGLVGRVLLLRRVCFSNNLLSPLPSVDSSAACFLYYNRAAVVVVAD
jgi:hypothetical protein